MKIINQTRHKIISEKIIVPKSLLDQSLGLLKYKTPTAMLLKTRYGIHTFGMRYPIDVVILNSDNRVAALKKNMKPNRIFIWNTQYETVLEFPTGTINKTQTAIDDQVSFSD